MRAVAKLSHANIVTAFDVGQSGETHYMAMEHLDGIDLAKLVQQSGPVPISNACEYVRQAAVGLQHAHERGLVHRDIKPGNLMVVRPGPDEPPVIKILDFGLARVSSETPQGVRLTQLGKIVGTVDYIAPEQAQNAQTADIRADVYSLGCMLFYLLTARPPFLGESHVTKLGARILGDVPSVRKVRAEVSPALEGVVGKMMATDPAARYQTPGEVAKALEPFCVNGKPAQCGAGRRQAGTGRGKDSAGKSVRVHAGWIGCRAAAAVPARRAEMGLDCGRCRGRGCGGRHRHRRVLAEEGAGRVAGG